MTKILRVATFNNFNFTDEELEHLEGIQALCPDYKIFVNSNSHPVIRGRFPCVITVNPELDVFTKPKGDLSLIKAIRIKYVMNPVQSIQDTFGEIYNWTKKHNIPTLITYMRFKNKETLKRYTTKSTFYKWNRSFYRPILKHTFNDPSIYYCDLRDEGCPSCRNCAKLTYGIDTPEIYSINLSSSGICPYNCVDCYAKCLAKFTHFAYDKILQNAKQKGHK